MAGDEATQLSALHLRKQGIYMMELIPRCVWRDDVGAKASKSKTQWPWLSAGKPPAVKLYKVKSFVFYELQKEGLFMIDRLTISQLEEL